mgnify:FL=1|tara:strand:- start:12710 stop:13426 length:717 start_codon:yes stop_codon:yes gene_type:complete
MASFIKRSIVIPCYNEEGNLKKLILSCQEHLCSNFIEVILVDNGSTDGSQEIISSLIGSNDLLKSIRVEKNIGYGNGILKGLKYATGDYIGWTHADLQTDPKDVLRGFELMGDENSFVKGVRKGRGVSENFFTIGMAIFESFLLKTFLWEINAQPTLFHKNFFTEWDSPPDDFSLDLFAYFFAKKHKLKIKRFKVNFSNRYSGKSSWNNGLLSKFILIKRTIIFSLKLSKKINIKDLD